MFKDHFSRHADAYAGHRPDYPAALFDYLATGAGAREVAWDVATGNGQAALALARHFAQVWATDASAEQIRAATPHQRVAYGVAPAETSGLESASVDLITVAQALHWLDLPRFYAEVLRVLRPGGVIAVWCYHLMSVSPEVDRVLRISTPTRSAPTGRPNAGWSRTVTVRLNSRSRKFRTRPLSRSNDSGASSRF